MQSARLTATSMVQQLVDLLESMLAPYSASMTALLLARVKALTLVMY